MTKTNFIQNNKIFVEIKKKFIQKYLANKWRKFLEIVV